MKMIGDNFVESAPSLNAHLIRLPVEKIILLYFYS